MIKINQSKKIKRILILGNSGFVGQRLQEFFVRKYPHLQLMGKSSQEMDLTKIEETDGLKEYFDSNTLVIMCSGIKSNYGNDLESYRKNVAMAENVSKVLSTHPVHRFIFFSSIAVYGVNNHNESITEKTPVHLDSYYGLSKYVSEQLLSMVMSKYAQSSLVILRTPTIYGPNEKIIAQTPSGFLATYLNGEEITLWGDGSELREFLFLEDLVRIVDMLVSSNYSGILNPGSGKSSSYKESVELISKLLEKKIAPRSRERTKEKVDKVYDITLFRELFPNFSFTTLEEGLRFILNINDDKTKSNMIRTICNSCQKKTVKKHIDLGRQPICNRFLDSFSSEEQTFALQFGQCEACGLAQLVNPPPYPEIIPKYNWITYEEPEEHLDSLAEKIKMLPGLTNESNIVGISFKDKPLVKRIYSLGLHKAIIIPSQQWRVETEVGVETIQAALTFNKAKEMIVQNGQSEVVIARHILEHAYDIPGFLAALNELVRPGGYVVIEVPDSVKFFANDNYALIWEEHLSYFTPATFKQVLQQFGFSLVHFENFPYVLENSLIAIAKKAERSDEQKLDKIVSLEFLGALKEEKERVKTFAAHFAARRYALQRYLRELVQNGEKIAIVGAGHLTCGFLNYFNIGQYFECVIDDNPNKNGLFLPGTKLPVQDSSVLQKKGITVCLLGVNPRNEIKVLKKNSEFIERGGKMLSIFPESSYALPLYGDSCNLKKVKEEVFIAPGKVIKIDQKYVDFIKNKAFSSTIKRARICCHQDANDPIHEMIITATKEGYVRPHKHEHKSESFHMIEGEMDVIIFKEGGAIEEIIEMGDYASGKKFYYRLSEGIYHTVIVKSPSATFHETTTGPFKKDEVVFAEWSPQEKDKEEIDSFLQQAAIYGYGKSYYKRKNCRLCLGTELELVVPIKPTPIGGAFVSKDQLGIKQELYSLDMYQCKKCGHVQLLDVVNPQILFSNYSYFSGRTTLTKHFAELAEKIIQKSELKENSFVVDIGSNDGAFLRFFKNRNMTILGVDPAENVAKYANESGIETLSTMFDIDASTKIRQEYGPADVITANNVFAHTDDMIGMAQSVRKLLSKDGTFYFEVSYLVDVIDKMILGSIFHEHLCYHTVKPLVSFLQQQGLELIDIERVPIQGGSLICAVQHKDGKKPISPLVNELIQLEEKLGIYTSNYFSSFVAKLKNTKTEVDVLIREIKFEGKSIAAFGAARGGTLLTYLFEMGQYIEYIVDDDPYKQNHYSPGYHIPVVPTSTIYGRHPDYVIILAWVHSKSIIEKNRRYLEEGGHFITFFPRVEIIDRWNVNTI